MTQIRYAVIDNHRKKRGHTYNFLFVTKSLREFNEYIEKKGLK